LIVGDNVQPVKLNLIVIGYFSPCHATYETS